MAIDKTSGFMKFSMVILSGNMVMDFFSGSHGTTGWFFQGTPTTGLENNRWPNRSQCGSMDMASMKYGWQSKNKKGTIKSQNMKEHLWNTMGNQWDQKNIHGIERDFWENICQGDLAGHIFNHLISKGVSENGVSPPAVINPWISGYIIFRQTHLGGSKLLAKNTWIHETEKT